MEVTLAVLADAANISREGKLNLLGVFNQVIVNTFPGGVPANLVMRLKADASEFGSQKQVHIVISDDDGHQQARIEGGMRVPTPEAGTVWEGINILQLSKLGFPKPGNYRVDILINGEPKAQISIQVIQKAQ